MQGFSTVNIFNPRCYWHLGFFLSCLVVWAQWARGSKPGIADRDCISRTDVASHFSREKRVDVDKPLPCSCLELQENTWLLPLGRA